MGWLKRLAGKTIGLDTAPLIYFVEGNPYFIDSIRPFFNALELADFFLTNDVCLGRLRQLEVLVLSDLKD